MSYDISSFEKGLKELGMEWNLEWKEQQWHQLLAYYELLIEKNKVMNLTSITEFDQVVTKHFLDSLSICQVMDFSSSIRILDLGTGAGFPGIPLKIMFPHLELVLMDSLNKRIIFLQEVIGKLGLKNITAIHGRAEEMARKAEYRESFDLVVSRAVANLSSLSEYCIPFVKKGGFFVSYKSVDVDEEIKSAARAIQILGGKKEQVYKFQLPDSDISRSFIKIMKINATPKKYPRKAGTPSKDPL